MLMKKKGIDFWSPAFKIRPKLFLNLSKQLTILQKIFAEDENVRDRSLYPVTLPHTEATQALKIILAGSSVNKKNIFPFLPGIKFEIDNLSLVYLPFTDIGHDLVQNESGISVNKQGLEFGRKL